MQFGGPTEPDEEQIPPFQSESHIRVLDMQDRRPIGHEMTGLTRPGLFLVRARVNEVDGIEVGSTVEKESANIGALSELRLKDIPENANSELLDAISDAISDDSHIHLQFYNSAGPMTRKFHSFQLLPGIGNSKAIQMVGLRGSGWHEFSAVDEACAIDSVRLLAERYLKEMEDEAQTPRLLDLLVRADL
jgi:predicted nucleic acid-binding OB-fold protein|tara:strand:- start:3090 stop:3659 length:570 start_codon:yes stop_codon:yes gene_type:complete